DRLRVLLTRRTDTLKHHPGQISLPGGRVEPDDADVRAAALRESEEEVGLPPACVDIVGYLPNFLTTTAYSVTPVVGFVNGAFTPTPDPSEVAEAFDVPLEFLFEPANQRRSTRTYFGTELPVYEFLYRHWRIWGVTAGVLMSFYYSIFSSKEDRSS
ncbi:MAG: CoA pyrophosphatase, partial [Pseudomonadota bacterium]